MNDNPEKKFDIKNEELSPIGEDNEKLIQSKRAAPPRQRPAAGGNAVRASGNNAAGAAKGAAAGSAGGNAVRRPADSSPASQRRSAGGVNQGEAVPPNAARRRAPSAPPARGQGGSASAAHRNPNVPQTDDDAIPVKIRRSAQPSRPSSPSEPVPSAPRALRRTQNTAPQDLATRKSDAASLPVPAEKKKGVSLFSSKKNARREKNGEADKSASALSGAVMMSGIIKAIIYMVVVVVVAVFISIFVIKIGNDVFAFVKSDVAIDVTIPEDATVDDIAEILYGDGIIKYPSMFKLYASIKHEEGPFIAGSYTVSPSMSYDELRYAFKEHVATGTSWITIPEGYSCDEIIDLMVSNGIGERDKYIDVINNYDFDYWFIDELEQSGTKEGRSYRLEGYLFPDTYEFYNASSEEMVINKLLKRFNEVFVTDYKTKAAELGYSVDQILTIASLIEKEAGNASDYMYVSSVFHNRLNNPWNYPRLESDATVVYAIQIGTGKRPNTVSPEDLSYESPYNTYLHEGLMPGPITNPSASAIRYALYPASTSYYYFVTADTGVAYYASSRDEHQRNIELVKSINASMKNGETN